MSGQDSTNPFDLRVVLGLLVGGGALFVLLLWMMGMGLTGGDTRDGGGHAGGTGLNGYAGLTRLLEQTGWEVERIRNDRSLKDVGLVILTPPHDADGKEIDKIVSARRYIGPTLVVTPKWQAANLASNAKPYDRGWVSLEGTGSPDWPGFRDDVNVGIEKAPPNWAALGLSGKLPAPAAVQWGSGKTLVPLVRSGDGKRVLAGYIADEGYYPRLNDMAGRGTDLGGDDEDLYPVVLVFEPDLIDNYGLADKATAQLAERLILAAADGRSQPVRFDLTLNGFARQANLLTLAFTPPFLAATICLLLAAIAVGWRALRRFGPTRQAERATAFGKAALIANSAGFLRRTGRLHLVAQPYAVLSGERIARALALPRTADADAREDAIDRALLARFPDAPRFGAAARTMRASRRPADIVRAAKELHRIERMLVQ